MQKQCCGVAAGECSTFVKDVLGMKEGEGLVQDLLLDAFLMTEFEREVNQRSDSVTSHVILYKTDADQLTLLVLKHKVYGVQGNYQKLTSFFLHCFCSWRDSMKNKCSPVETELFTSDRRLLVLSINSI